MMLQENLKTVFGQPSYAWRKKWQPTPVFLPGEFHRQSCLVGYSPWGGKELDMAERQTLSLFCKET